MTTAPSDPKALADEIARRTTAIDQLSREVADTRRQLAAARGEYPPARVALAVVVGAVLGGALPCLPHSCPAAMVSSEEIARLRSPTGDLDAIVVEINGGATTAFGYSVLVVSAGRTEFWGVHILSLDSAITPECARGVSLKWTAADDLEIGYRHAARVEGPQSPVLINGRFVNVQLHPDVRASTSCP